MSDLSVSWEDSAINMLDGRDRYTRNTIREEFRREPEKGAIEFDTAQHIVLTPVAENRFSVIWKLDPSVRRAVVLAVVALTNIKIKAPGEYTPDELGRLKDYVQRAIKTESNGQVSL